MKETYCLLIFVTLLITCKTQAQNNALDFDGVNDYVTVPAAAVYDLTSGTVECAVKPTSFGDGLTLLGVRGAGGTRYSFHMRYNSIGLWNGLYFFPIAYSFTLNTWYHLAFVGTGTTTKLYINGVYIDEFTYTFSSVSGQDLTIGAVKESGSASQLFAGSIDEVRIWNTTRTADEIMENKDISLSGNEPGLVALFSFDQGTPGGTNSGQSTLIDKTSSHNNGTLNNFALAGATSNYITSSLSAGAAAGASWLAAGNTGTLPAYNFIGTTDNRGLTIKTNNLERVTILSNGNVGIGTAAPTDALTVRSSAQGYGLKIQAPESPSAYAGNYIRFSSNPDFPQINEIVANGRLDINSNQQMFLKATDIFFQGNAIVTRTGDPSTTDPHSKSSKAMPFESNLWNGTNGVYQYAGIQNIAFDSTNLLHRLGFILKAANTDLGDGTEAMSILSSGNVGIGIVNPDVKLAVKGNIKAQKITITQTGWADYVFKKSYKLRSLSDVEKFIRIHKHLPDVPSAAEVTMNGIDIGDNQALLLKKVEELSLYLIDLNKRLIKQQKEIRGLKKQVKQTSK